MFSPIGNTVGQLIPVILVAKNLKTSSSSSSSSSSSDSNVDDDSNYTISGMSDLMLVELILCMIPVILAAFLLTDRPPTPPSNSMLRKSASTGLQCNSKQRCGWRGSHSFASQHHRYCMYSTLKDMFDCTSVIVMTTTCAYILYMMCIHTYIHTLPDPGPSQYYIRNGSK